MKSLKSSDQHRNRQRQRSAAVAVAAQRAKADGGSDGAAVGLLVPRAGDNVGSRVGARVTAGLGAAEHGGSGGHSTVVLAHSGPHSSLATTALASRSVRHRAVRVNDTRPAPHSAHGGEGAKPKSQVYVWQTCGGGSHARHTSAQPPQRAIGTSTGVGTGGLICMHVAARVCSAGARADEGVVQATEHADQLAYSQ